MTLACVLLLSFAPLQGSTVPDIEPLVVSENPYSQKQKTGRVTSPAGDWDGDGVPDYAIGLPDYDFDPLGGSPGSALPNSGRVEIYSGATGAELYSWSDPSEVDLLGNSLEARLGAAIAGPFDSNLNGRPEVAIGLPGVDKVHFVEVGDSGFPEKVGQISKPIDFTGQVVWDEFGAVLENLGDVDGDGREDLGIGAPATRRFVGPVSIDDVGAVNVRSSATLLSIAQIVGDEFEGRFGASVCGVADLSGDGVRDVAIGEPGENRVRLYAPADPAQSPGVPVDTILAPPGQGFEVIEGFGSELADLGNLNGSGPGDLLVEADQVTSFFFPGFANLSSIDLSVPGGSVRWSVSVEAFDQTHSIAAADLDGDGKREALRTLAVQGFDGDLGLFLPVDSVLAVDAETGLTVAQFPAPGLIDSELGFGDLARVGDCDGDGGDDVIVGLPDAGYKGGAILYGLAVDGVVAPPATYTVDDFPAGDFTSLALAALVAPPGSTLLAERAIFGSWGDVYLSRSLSVFGVAAGLGRLEVDRLTVDQANGVAVVAATADSLRVTRSSGRVTFADFVSQADSSFVESSGDVSFVDSRFTKVVDPFVEGDPAAALTLLASDAQLVGSTITGADGPGLSSDGGVGLRAGTLSTAYLFATDVTGGDGAPGAGKFAIAGGSGANAIELDSQSTAVVRGNSHTAIRGGRAADFGAGLSDGLDIAGDAPAGEIAFVDPAVVLENAVGVQLQDGPTPYLLHPGNVAIGSSFDVRVHAGLGLPVYVTITDQPALLDFSLLIEWVPLWVEPNSVIASATVLASGLETPTVVSFPVPNDPQFIGAQLHLQAFAPQVNGNIFDGTNGNGFAIRN